ncbi:MAG: riboflavin synthase, partial [Ilumatobacteraceae bacterium]
MFTGIVEELGKVAELNGSRLRISAQTVLEGSKIGSSIAVNGCCLTVVDLDSNSWIT